MKKVILILTLSILPYNVYTAKTDQIQLTPEDLPSGYTLGDQFGSYTLHSKSFFEMPSMQGALPKPLKKRYQTLLKDSKPIGTILYFQYKKGENLNPVISFLKGMLWSHHMGPSKFYPEELYIHENIVMIFSLPYRSAESDFLIDIFQKKTGKNLRNESTNLENYVTKEYDVPGSGKLTLHVPKSFQDEYHKPEADNPASIELSIPNSKEFSISLALYPTEENENMYNAENLWGILNKYSKRYIKNAVERKADIVELSGINHSGYYYVLTDKSLSRKQAPDGKYKYFFQGGIRSGEVLIFFVIMSQNQKDSEEIQSLFKMLSLAWQTPNR